MCVGETQYRPVGYFGVVHTPVSYTHLDVYKRQCLLLHKDLILDEFLILQDVELLQRFAELADFFMRNTLPHTDLAVY